MSEMAAAEILAMEQRIATLHDGQIATIKALQSRIRQLRGEPEPTARPIARDPMSCPRCGGPTSVAHQPCDEC